jgi:retron-type reverse transcriptase
MEHELKGIRYQSRTHRKLETLMNRVNEEAIKEEHRKQSGKKATGVDGVTKGEYSAELDKNVADLISRMKRFSYKPQPVRRTYIPKANGKLRPLGIPAYEDKLVQGVMAGILNDVYEERFLDCSYGFRPDRNAHDTETH